MSLYVALLKLIIKLPCFSDIFAPPHWSPLSPHLSIKKPTDTK